MTQPSAGLLQPLPMPNDVWEDISMGFIMGLPKSKGNIVILVVVEKLAKYANFEAFPTSFTTRQVDELFLDIVVKHQGFP